MKTLFRTITHALAIISAIGPVTAAPAIPLDTLLEGVTDQCNFSKPLMDLIRELSASAQENRPARIAVGPAEAFGTPVSKEVANDGGDYYEINLPLNASWKGVPISSLQLLSGKENGIFFVTIEFETQKDKAREIFAPLAEASKKRMAADPQNYSEATTDIGEFEGRFIYYCDRST